MATKVIIVGGGLSGATAANTVLQAGGSVLLLDKSGLCGGNSTKATSGINGTPTKTQTFYKINDSVDIFKEDIFLSASGGKEAKQQPLGKLLAEDSGSSLDWLMNYFNIDLSLLSRMGGHSQKRTHRGKEYFPGMVITMRLLDELEATKKADPTRCSIINKARVTKLLMEGDKVVGVSQEKDGKALEEHGPVVLATGGQCADQGADSLLKKYRPELMALPTTNGEHCTGDGVKMAMAVGGHGKDLNHVQVHPTGLVLPTDPDKKEKWLAAEALRGVGGIMLDPNGKRFVNEMATRDFVSGEMQKRKAPFRLVLNKAAAKEIMWHCKKYMQRNVMKHFTHGKDLAKEMQIAPEVLEQTFNDFNKAWKDGFDPSGKCPKQPKGRVYFEENTHPWKMDDELQVSVITPVVHQCMGGIAVDTTTAVLTEKGQQMEGLQAAGEVMGGVHGINRLGGNSLLDCVLYGRVAGKEAAKQLLSSLTKSVLSGSAGRLQAVQQSLKGDTKAEAKKEESKDTGKEQTLEEVAKHNKGDDMWVAVNGQVLDVSKFKKEHPGGEQAIEVQGGTEASEPFNMFHPPGMVEKQAPWTVIGKLKQ